MKTYIPQTKDYPKLASLYPSAWGDIPTIIKDIIDRFNIKPNSAIEFGVEYGYSTSTFANYFNNVTGVDIFTGDIHAGFKGDIYESTKTNLKEFQNINLIKQDYKDFIIENDSNYYDLSHIDIIHTYEDTYRCGEWCVKHSDVILFHDTMSFPEVYKVCVDLATKYNLDFFNYENSYGLGILAHKKKIIIPNKIDI
jgi:cephalosporin hydroxylase